MHRGPARPPGPPCDGGEYAVGLDTPSDACDDPAIPIGSRSEPTGVGASASRSIISPGASTSAGGCATPAIAVDGKTQLTDGLHRATIGPPLAQVCAALAAPHHLPPPPLLPCRLADSYRALRGTATLNPHLLIGLPIGVRVSLVLMAHQLEGVRWLFAAFGRGGGLLTDELGLGKTLQVIALVEALVRAGRATRILAVAPANLWVLPNANQRHSPLPTPHSPLPTPHSLLPTPYSLLPIPCSLLPTTYYLLPTTYSRLPTPCSLLLGPHSLLPATYHLTPNTEYRIPTPTTYYLPPTLLPAAGDAIHTTHCSLFHTILLLATYHSLLTILRFPTT